MQTDHSKHLANCLIGTSLRSCFFLAMVPAVATGQARPAELRATRELTIDATANDLSSVNFVDAFSNGTIVVGQPEDRLVRFFSPKGQPLKSFGRRGSGPGEFQQVNWYHGFVGDTLWIDDGALRRQTLLRAPGTLVRNALSPIAVRLESGTSLPGSGDAYLRGLDGLGNRLVHVIVPKRDLLPRAWEPWLNGDLGVVIWVSPSGEFRRIVSGDEGLEKACGGTAPVKMRECPRAMSGAGPNGALYVVATTVVSATGAARVTVTGISSKGDTAFQQRLAIDAVPIPARRNDSLRAAIVSRAATPSIAAYWRNAEFPRFYRLVHHLFVGHDNTTWLGLGPNNGKKRWLILRPNGQLLGQFEVPERIDIMAGTASTFWGTDTDDDGLESVVRYQVSAGQRQQK